MSEGELSDLHIAELHERAADAGISGYRMLPRDDLIAALEGDDSRTPPARRPARRAPDVDPDRDTDELAVIGPGGTATSETGESEAAESSDEAPRRRRGRRGGRGRGRERERLANGSGSEGRGAGDERRERGGRGDRNDEENAETEEITGTLEITRQRHGFLRVEGSDDDVYVSASQVRRCELSDGDEVTGPARSPRRGERHRALVRVNLVNGEEPVSEPPAKASGAAKSETAPKSGKFDTLTPVQPTRRIELGDSGVLVRAADLLSPLAMGQRVLVRAAPRSGRTTFLRGLAHAFEAAEGIELTVLLIDERPEEVAAWREALPDADLALAPADLSPAEQVKVATDALERVRKQAADGSDAVLLCDSLTRLAVAANGVDEVKRLFGSGRELAEDDAGSLTVIATTLGDADDEGSAERAVQTTETALVALDASLAAEGIVPALRFAECRAVGEENLISEQEQTGLRHLRVTLADLVPPEAAGFVRERLEGSASNAELLRELA